MSIFKPGELKLLWNFYLYLVFWTFSLMIQPYIFIYFRDLGFSFTQIASFTSAMMISLFIFEVPTGVVADLFGRKKSVFIGLIISGVSPILISLTDSYAVILFCYILIGLGITFISGAEDALIVDNLKSHNRNDLIKEYYVKMSSFMGLGTVTAFLLGSYIVKLFGIKPLWIIWGGGYLLSAGLLMFIREYGFKPVNKHKTYVESVFYPIKMSLNFIKSNRVFLNYLVGSTMVTIMVIQHDLWNVLLTDNGISNSQISLIAAITSFVIIFVPWYSKKVQSIRKALIITTSIRVALLMASVFIDSNTVLYGVCLFIVLGSLSSFESPLTSTYVQHQVSSENRATIGSVLSMIYSLTGAMAGMGIGIISDLIGIQYSIGMFSIFGLFAIYYYWNMSSNISSELSIQD